MRKIALLLAVALAVTAPSAAFAAKKSKAAAKAKVYDTTAANQNESAFRFVKDGIWNLGLRGPAWSQAVSK
jgi:hypothetical protein